MLKRGLFCISILIPPTFTHLFFAFPPLNVCVFRSNANIEAQIIDDVKGVTLVSASSLEKELNLKNGGNVEAAKVIGAEIAKRAKKAKINTVVFDRGGYLYHGRVKALAEAAREGGLEF